MKGFIGTITGRWGITFLLAAALMFGAGVDSTVQAKEDKTYKTLKLFTDVLEELEKNYIDEVDTEELIHNAIKGMVENLDPHSSFMPPEAFDELQDDTKGEFSGIGIVITVKDGILTVISPIEGTPAYDAGIEAGDVIIRIDGESTRDMALWEAVNLLRGPRFEEVVITVIREGVKDPMIVPLKRDLIPMTSVKSTILEPGYGYLRVTNFRMNTDTEIEEALEKMDTTEAPLKGLIIDLRHNPGGLLDQAVRVADLFLDDGVIVSIKGRKEGQGEAYRARPGKTERDYPIVVLINSGSASASEILAGALQDQHRALVLGTTSFGKGSVQTVRPLKDGFGIKYTIARYYTPSGRSIQAKGIEPDITVDHEILPKKEKEESAFDRMIREKDLKNSLEPEKGGSGKDSDSNRKKSSGTLDTEQLQRDVQVKRALDILISYGVFSRINGS
ncbi:MAG: S41 family peptidase [Desulfobacteraceae bacterium]|nr:MAG: S41 family peptidase [Desulfobacteraceae bacterium]